MKLVVATRNAGKLKEIRRLLATADVEVLGLASIADAPEVEEDGATFEANAIKKAVTLAQFCGCPTLADDSGLAVDVLDGAPGVHSARYAGPMADDEANNRKLLAALADVPPERRTAAFHCAMALATPDGRSRTCDGLVRGRILEAPRGEGGFGYDPLFLVAEYGRTMAELPLDIKNRISHRGQALRRMLPLLQSLL